MKIQILSDLHLEFHPMEIPHTDADIVILAGDIHVGDYGLKWVEQFEKPVIYVPGNHEYYEYNYKHWHLGQGIDGCENVTILNRGWQVFPESNLVVIGCTSWTDFDLDGDRIESSRVAQRSMNDFRLIKYGDRDFRPEDSVNIHLNERSFLTSLIESLRESVSSVVVVTHHAPSVKSIHADYIGDPLNPAFASNLEGLMQPPVKLWVHGHVHNSFDYMVNKTRVICNPRGYCNRKGCENKEFNSRLVVEV